jgi:cobalt-precorrin 5A hydrolase
VTQAFQSVAVYALTAPGAETARRIGRGLPDSAIFLPDRLVTPQFNETGFKRFASALANNFGLFSGHVVVGAAGIVVRSLALLLKDKTRDPAVVVVDQAGQFAVSLLSGHLGGANELARQVAAILDGQPVITTATDVSNVPSLDVLAAELGHDLENLKALAVISRCLVEGEKVRIYDPYNLWGPALKEHGHLFEYLKEMPGLDDRESLVYVGEKTGAFSKSWLLVRPPVLVVGMGCNRGTDAGEMETLVADVFRDHQLSIKSIQGIATIDAKADEAGLNELAGRLGVNVQYFSADELKAVQTPNPSATVKKHMGVSSVCEAAALLAARADRLLATKAKSKNVTMAVARIDFT